MTSENAEKTNGRWRLIAVLAIVGVGVIAALGLIEAWVYSRFDEWPIRGLVGDMFGVGNAVFSALALVGVIIAIYLQNKELGLQRQELVLTRTEVKGQREQLQAQAAETLKKQLPWKIRWLPVIEAFIRRVFLQAVRQIWDPEGANHVPYRGKTVRKARSRGYLRSR